MWIVAGIGLLAALFGIIIGFVPPAQVTTGNEVFYDGFLVVGIIIMVGIPIVVNHIRKPSWKKGAQATPEKKPIKKPKKKKRR